MVIARAVIRTPWWWRHIYWPLTLTGIWLGLPINPDRVVQDFKRIAKVQLVED